MNSLCIKYKFVLHKKQTHRNYQAGYTHRRIIYWHKISFIFTLVLWRLLFILGTKKGIWVGKEKEVTGTEVSEEEERKGHRWERKQVWPRFPAAHSLDIRTQCSATREEQRAELPEAWSPRVPMLDPLISRWHQQVLFSSQRAVFGLTSACLSTGCLSVL